MEDETTINIEETKPRVSVFTLQKEIKEIKRELELIKKSLKGRR